MNENAEVLIIGGGVVDIPLRPVGKQIFDVTSYPLDGIRMCAGGDAVNESIILSRLGRRVSLCSKMGDDGAGDYLIRVLRDNGVDTDLVVREAGLDTGINIVMIREDAERSFITNRNGSLRRLALSDVLPALSDARVQDARVCSFASLFVSPMLPPTDMAALFAAVKARGMILCADTTSPKNHETCDDIAELLPYVDYFFPNYEEAAKISGEQDLDAIADAFLSRGLKNIVIKTGAKGCFLKNANLRAQVPAWRGTKCIDTTGAGDNFAAAFIAALLDGRDFTESARYANAAASVCVESLGATDGVINREETDRRYREMVKIG